MDILTVLGLLIALAAIVGGQLLEGGHVGSLLQTAAFLIVIVGSLGATMVATPTQDLRGAALALRDVLIPPRHDFRAMLEKILSLATLARREGLLALESYITSTKQHPFLVKCLMLAIDGSSSEVIRETVETDMAIDEENKRAAARFWETWGSICPTVGVLGAVIGLIHVMENIGSPDELGPGIAVAFVATVYGVGFANLVCLPLAFKLKRQIERDQQIKSMVLEGVVAIQSGVAPGALRTRLSAYLGSTTDANRKA